MSNSITQEEVAKIAQLARLQLTDDELAAATQDISNILSHFASIQSIDTTGVPTADDASGLANISREDSEKPEELASHKDLLGMVPQVENDQIKVQAVFSD